MNYKWNCKDWGGYRKEDKHVLRKVVIVVNLKGGQCGSLDVIWAKRNTRRDII